MGGDAFVARGRATADGQTLFAHNGHGPAGEGQPLRRLLAGGHSPGEKVRTQFLELPQARATFQVLGSQPAGCWGFAHGLNEHGVAAGATGLATRLECAQPVLTVTDLVRLALERARTARQAVDLIGDLIGRHGQGRFPASPAGTAADGALLVADGAEAFALEAAGPHWVYQEILQVRALSDVATIRQDWDRISPGLAAHAIGRGWWPDDGSKLDFGGAVAEDPVGQASALRRWGRATVMLEEQSGHIDVAFLRRLLSDHYEGMHGEVDPRTSRRGPVPLCRHAAGPAGTTTAAGMVAALGGDPDRPMVAWCAFGPPCISVFFPVLPDGELPAPFMSGGLSATSLCGQVHEINDRLRRDPVRWDLARETFSRLQASLDQETEEFLDEAAGLKRQGAAMELQRRATLFMQANLERFERVVEDLVGPLLAGVTDRPGDRVEEEVAGAASLVEFYL